MIHLDKQLINGVHGAQLEQSTDQEGTTFFVRLLTDHGNVNLTSYPGHSTKRDIVTKINTFINNPEEGKITVSDPGVEASAVIIVCLLSQIPIIWFASYVWRKGSFAKR